MYHKIENAITTAIADASVACSGEGCSLQIKVVSTAFKALNPVQRHQLVYRALGPLTEELHAISLKTLTPDEV